MIQVIKRLGAFIGALVLIIAGYLGAAVLGGVLPGRAADLPLGDDVQIGLLYGPIHVDFLLPATPETRQALDFASEGGVRVHGSDVGYFVVGWGARDFYTTTPEWADLSMRATLRAIAGDASVLRVDTTPPYIAFDQVPQISLSQAQYNALLEQITQTAALGGIGLEGQDNDPIYGFVEAQGRFNILRTCNTWVGRVLRASGLPMGAWTPTPYSVRLSLWRAGLS